MTYFHGWVVANLGNGSSTLFLQELSARKVNLKAAWLHSLQDVLFPLGGIYPERSSEVRAISQVLERHRGDRTSAARELGMSRTTLWRKIRRLHIG